MKLSIERARTLGILAGCAIIAGAYACADLVRTNPFDPLTPVKITIAGIDSFTSAKQFATFTAVIDPAWPDAPVIWGDPEFSRYTGFTLVVAHSGGGDVAVTVHAGPHSATKIVPYRQRFRRIEFTPCSVACVAFLDAGTGNVSLTPEDSSGSELTTSYANLPITVVSRDTSIATIQSLTVRQGTSSFVFQGHNRGSTWVIWPGFASDSIRVFYDYRPQLVQLNCPTSLQVGADAQISSSVSGPSGIPLLYEVPIKLRLVQTTGEAGLFTNAVLRGVTPGSVSVIATETMTNKARTCDVTITP